MKHSITKKLLIAGLAVIAVPSLLFAQKEKEKVKDKSEMQTIVITRAVDVDVKTVIEIDGNKIKVNGKDAKDNKDINVNVNTTSAGGRYHVYTPSQGRGFTFDSEAMSMYDVDENRAMLGVTTETDEKGAEIKTVTTAGGADKAGLKKGDIITKIGDKKIENGDGVTKAIRSHKPGDKVSVTFLRDGKEQKATAELGKWKGVRMNLANAPRIPTQVWGEGMQEKLKMDMEGLRMNLDDNEFNGVFSFNRRPKLGLSIQDSDDGKGVKVLEVDEESNAAKAGILKDDVILSVDDKEVKGTDDVTSTLRENKEKYTFNFKVQRGGKTQNIEVKMPRKLKTADL
ncbi:MAG: PDZ domain-containing protein [Bacteroidota bacterium]